MDLPEKSTPSPAKEDAPTRSPAQHSTRAEASEQVALPPGTHSPARIREQQHRDVPTAYTVFYGPDNYSAIRDMPMEPDSHTKGLAAVEEATAQSANSAHADWRPFYPPEEEAIRNQISTQSTTSSPASTVGAQTESIHRDIPPASSISRADDRTHDRSQPPSSLAKMKEEAPLAKRNFDTPFRSREKET
ncbi:uncharacterized protein K444DRAFT_630484 [Hyaloscypha bicolor E]|uniref:Uncharacterized protein n=1 Tax=Hyaloscypha bicolor E TaxID=1095630 RepID=A0A2J6T702_9HELO|nr:uncharacterized protein K444DRAFT_630484 [Hyaloscypha bicolor E]PMD58805.1 hypothetical protein K444DRAFT_630484 [Hyaloscypha bicolor E]